MALLHLLDSLFDVVITSPQEGETLKRVGAAWINSRLALNQLQDIPSYPTSSGRYFLTYDQASGTYSWDNIGSGGFFSKFFIGGTTGLVHEISDSNTILLKGVDGISTVGVLPRDIEIGLNKVGALAGETLVYNSDGSISWEPPITIASASSAYLEFDTATRELSVSGLTISDVEVDNVETSLAAWVAAHYTGTEYQMGDILILTNTPQPESWIHNGGIAGTIADWTQLSTIPSNYDSTFRILNTVDPTKRIAFDASSISTSTVRTLTVQNKNYTIAGLDDITALSGVYFPLTGGTITGTSGAGFIGLPHQITLPTTPTSSGLRLYANGPNLGWVGSDGYERQFAGTITGGRTYNLPNSNGTFGLLETAQTWTGVNTFSPSGSGGSGFTISTTSRFSTVAPIMTDAQVSALTGQTAGGWVYSSTQQRPYVHNGTAFQGIVLGPQAGFTAGQIAYGGTGGNIISSAGLTWVSDYLFTVKSTSYPTFQLQNNAGSVFAKIESAGPYGLFTLSASGGTNGFFVSGQANSSGNFLHGSLQLGAITGRTSFLDITPSQSGGDISGAGYFFRIRTSTFVNNVSPASAVISSGSLNSFDGGSVSATNTGIVYTNLATLRIAAAPTAGTNVTITNPWAIQVANGNSFFPRVVAGTNQINASGFANTYYSTAPIFASGNASNGVGLVAQVNSSTNNTTVGIVGASASGSGSVTHTGYGVVGEVYGSGNQTTGALYALYANGRTSGGGTGVNAVGVMSNFGLYSSVGGGTQTASVIGFFGQIAERNNNGAALVQGYYWGGLPSAAGSNTTITTYNPLAIKTGNITDVTNTWSYIDHQVSIGTTSQTNSTALLDLVSTTKGLLIPRMTTVQRDAITSPATGLEIYNISTNRTNFYNGTAWVENIVSSGTSGISAGQIAYGGSGGNLTSSANFAYSDTRPTLSLGASLTGSSSTPAFLDMGNTISSTAGANPKISLYSSGGAVGFGISTASLDYVAQSSFSHSFYLGGTRYAQISSSNLQLFNNASLKFGYTVASPTTPLIDMFGGTYGFSITSATMNYFVGNGAKHDFYVNGGLVMRINPNGFLGFGNVTPTSFAHFAPPASNVTGDLSGAGYGFRLATATYTNTTTATSGTVANASFASFDGGTIASTNTGVIYTNASTLRIAAAPMAGTNTIITNAWALEIVSGASIFNGALNYGSHLGTSTIKGDLNFDNGSNAAYIKQANSLNRSIKIPGTGGNAHWEFRNTSSLGVQVIDGSNNLYLFGNKIRIITSSFSGDIDFLNVANSTANNRRLGIGNGANQYANEKGYNIYLTAGQGGAMASGFVGGDIVLQTGAGGGSAAYGNVFIPNGIVGVGTITPNASAILELTSTTQGFLKSRLTTVQRDAIVSPAIGLEIYNTTTNRQNYWNGTAWVEQPSVASGGFGTNQVAVGTSTGNLSSSSGLVFDGTKLTISVTGGILINGSYTGTASVGVAIGGTINATNGTESPIAIGSGSSTTASRGIAMGLSATAANGIAMGREAIAGDNEFVMGGRVSNSNSLRVLNLKFGADANSTTSGSFRAISQGAAFGTDQIGGSFGIYVGAGTGAAKPGSFTIFTPNLLASGSTVQTTYTAKFLLDGQTQQFQLGPTATSGSSALDLSNVNNLGARPFPLLTTTQRNAIAGRVINANFSSTGSGYSSAPTVSITGGGGSGATAVATISSGGVIAVTIINQGSGYTSAPTISFSGGGGSGASFTAVTTNEVDGLGIYNTTTKTYQHYETTSGTWRDFGSYQSNNLSVGSLIVPSNVAFQIVSTTKMSLPAPVMTFSQRNLLTGIQAGMVYSSSSDEYQHFDAANNTFVGLVKKGVDGFFTDKSIIFAQNPGGENIVTSSGDFLYNSVARTLQLLGGGNILLGTGSITTDVLLEVKSTDAASIPMPKMTSTQRDALTASQGMMVYNTTTNKPELYEGSNWIGFSKSDYNFAFDDTDTNLLTAILSSSTVKNLYNNIIITGRTSSGATSNSVLLLPTPDSDYNQVTIQLFCLKQHATYTVGISAPLNTIMLGNGSYTDNYSLSAGQLLTIRAMQDPADSNNYKWVLS